MEDLLFIFVFGWPLEALRTLIWAPVSNKKVSSLFGSLEISILILSIVNWFSFVMGKDTGNFIGRVKGPGCEQDSPPFLPAPHRFPGYDLEKRKQPDL